jgi:tRNA dimethylallyltransferase
VPAETRLPSGLVVAIFGPTGSGKTAAAEALARRIPADVVSADSAALYRGLEILTAAPAPPTRLVGVLDLTEEASVVEYQRLAHAAIDEIVAAARTPLVVGGTGLYLRAALSDLTPPSAPPPGTRARWERLYDRLGPQRAHELLSERDPPAAERVHANDRRRVVRALELAEAGASLRPQDDRLWSPETRLPTALVGLDLPKDELDRRLEARARSMLDRGVADEARAALALSPSTTASKIMGLREAAELPPDEAAEALVQASRRLARYQRKWMRRLPGLVTLAADRPADEVADAILEVARARQQLSARRAG